MIDLTNPNLKTWVEIPNNTDFPIQNLPFGIFTNEDKSPRVCSRIGDTIIDIGALGRFGFFNEIDFDESTLLKKFLNNQDTLISNVNQSFVKEYRGHLKKEGLNDNSIKTNLSRLRTILRACRCRRATR